MNETNFEPFDCPNCGETLSSKSTMCRYCGSGISREHFCECRFCGEMVRINAVLCRFCKSNLRDRKPQAEHTPLIESIKYRSTQLFTRGDLERLCLVEDEPMDILDIRCQIGQSGTEAIVSLEPHSGLSVNLPVINERAYAILAQLQKDYPDRGVNDANCISLGYADCMVEKFSAEVGEAQDKIREEIRKNVDADPAPLTLSEKEILYRICLDEVLGFGPLGPLLRDPCIGNIYVNSFDSLYVEHNGQIKKTTLAFQNEAHLRQTIDKITNPMMGLKLSRSSPIINLRLPNGARVNATMTAEGATLTVRCFGLASRTLAQLVVMGALNLSIAEVLKACVKARINMIICGPPGSGKNMLMNALAHFISERERLIVVENNKGFQFHHSQWIGLERSPSFAQISVSMLIDAAMQMCPDRLVVNELHAEESVALLEAMLVRLNGTMTTMFANSTSDCLNRLETMLLVSKTGMTSVAARKLIANTMQLIVQIDRLTDGTRRITEIAEIKAMENDEIKLSPIFHLENDGRDSRGFLNCYYVSSGDRPKFLGQMERESVPFKLEWLR